MLDVVFSVMGDNKYPLFIAPKCDWAKPNLYDQFKIFSKKVKFTFDGQFKDSDNKVKVIAFSIG